MFNLGKIYRTVHKTHWKVQLLVYAKKNTANTLRARISNTHLRQKYKTNNVLIFLDETN
jgi:hypothetical protein